MQKLNNIDLKNISNHYKSLGYVTKANNNTTNINSCTLLIFLIMHFI